MQRKEADAPCRRRSKTEQYPYLKEQIKDDGMYYVLLDEVQLLGEFEAILNSLMATSYPAAWSTASTPCSMVP